MKTFLEIMKMLLVILALFTQLYTKDYQTTLLLLWFYIGINGIQGLINKKE